MKELKKEKAATIGTFDGVHRGHRLVMDYLREEAARRGLTPAAVTFATHPLTVVAPGRAPLSICTTSRRDGLLASLGVEVLDLPFDEQTRRLTAAQWLRHLHDDFDVRLLVMGHDHKFGSDCRELSPDDFLTLAHDAGIEPLRAPELPGISSSAVRNAITTGDLEEAARMLGRPFALEGTVIHGRKLGRTIGMPTANLRLPEGMIMPPPGVYAAKTAPEEGGSAYPAVVNIGVNPTVSSDTRLKTEVHIMGFDGNLYDKLLTVNLIKRLRDERKFDGLDDLRRAVGLDIAAARNILGR